MKKAVFNKTQLRNSVGAYFGRLTLLVPIWKFRTQICESPYLICQGIMNLNNLFVLLFHFLLKDLLGQVRVSSVGLGFLEQLNRPLLLLSLLISPTKRLRIAPRLPTPSGSRPDFKLLELIQQEV